MTYGKEYKILKNFDEWTEEVLFEEKLRKLIGKSALFIDGVESNTSKDFKTIKKS